MTLKQFLAILVIGLLISGSAAAQTATPTSDASDSDPTITTAFQDVVVYAGPGTSFLQLNILHAGIPAQIVERNSIGTWLHVQPSITTLP